MFRQIHSIRQLRKSIFFQQSKTLKLALVSQVESPTFPPFYCLCQNSTLLSLIKKKKKLEYFYLLQNPIAFHHILDVVCIVYILSHVLFFFNGFEDGSINIAWANGIHSHTALHQISSHLPIGSRRLQISVVS